MMTWPKLLLHTLVGAEAPLSVALVGIGLLAVRFLTLFEGGIESVESVG